MTGDQGERGKQESIDISRKYQFPSFLNWQSVANGNHEIRVYLVVLIKLEQKNSLSSWFKILNARKLDGFLESSQVDSVGMSSLVGDSLIGQSTKACNVSPLSSSQVMLGESQSPVVFGCYRFSIMAINFIGKSKFIIRSHVTVRSIEISRRYKY